MLNPLHDFSVSSNYLIGLRRTEEAFWDFILHPLDELFRFVASENFLTNPVNAEDISLPVVMNYTLPKEGADIKRNYILFVAMNTSESSR